MSRPRAAMSVATSAVWRPDRNPSTAAVREAYGAAGYEIASDAAHGQITATVEIPARNPPSSVLLRLRHPGAKPWLDAAYEKDYAIRHLDLDRAGPAHRGSEVAPQAAMQRVQPEMRQVGGLRMAIDPDHSALFTKLI